MPVALWDCRGSKFYWQFAVTCKSTCERKECFYHVQFGFKIWLLISCCWWCLLLKCSQLALAAAPSLCKWFLEGKLISLLAYSNERRKKSVVSLWLSGVHPSFFHRIVMDMYFQGLYRQPVPFMHFVEFIIRCVHGWKWHTCCSECSFSDVSCFF